MAQALQQQFVPLSGWGLGPKRVTELALHRGEGRFDVRPLVIPGEKFVPVQLEEVERLVPERRFGGAGTGNRFGQTRGHAVGEIDANSGFHVKIPLKRR